MQKKLKILPLGGVGEIGKNMTVLEYGEDLIIIDCGMSFPAEDMPGIDIVIPDMTYLRQNRNRIRGILITHGHEDHIGAIPYALAEFDVPVYGTAFTVALIAHKLEESGLADRTLVTVRPKDTVALGCFRVEFIKAGHSIAGAVSLAVTTPIGTVIHTGDFKVDFTPIDGEPIDLNRFAYYGTKGVLALMSDSTNVEREGHTASERDIGPTFDRVFDRAEGRIIVASFASNVYRIQQIADEAVEHRRVICFQGRSMEQVVQTAIRLGYLSIPEESIVTVDKLSSYPENRVCVITTGSQGEPMSGLFRMANAAHRLNIKKGDTVIISASAIPGNEVGVSRVINQLFEKGASVVYDQMADVHVSGHACREELRLMLELTKPKYFIPVHGEYRHLVMHAMLAREMGIPQENIFIPEIGEVIALSSRSGKKEGNVPSGSVLVDGLGDIDDIVLKDRITLSKDGVVVAVLVIDSETGRLLSPPEIISRGFVYMRESEDLISEAVYLLTDKCKAFETAGSRSEYNDIKSGIRSSLKSFLKKKTQRTPMVIPIVIEI